VARSLAAGRHQVSLIIGSTTDLSLTDVPTGGAEQHAPPADSGSSDSPGVTLERQLSQRSNAYAVAQINDALAQNAWKIEFVVDKSIDRLIVKVIDTRTNEVLVQVPTESMPATARALADGPQAGALIDRQA
jgi:uncharacterized FlaG/YvyC family protein